MKIDKRKITKIAEKLRTDYIVDCMSGRIEEMIPYDKAINDFLEKIEELDNEDSS